MEQKVTIPCGEIVLEGRLERLNEANGVVVMHPHPLYGGDMQNPVVESLIRAYAGRGYSTLRFNFRGIGESSGDFDHGRGEQMDILAAIAFLGASGIQVADLAGYSFGAWVLAKIPPPGERIKRVLMVAPPVAFMDFSGIKPPFQDIRVITGSRDDFAPPDEVKKWLAACGLGDITTIVKDADHFFNGCLHQLENAVSRAIGP